MTNLLMGWQVIPANFVLFVIDLIFENPRDHIIIIIIIIIMIIKSSRRRQTVPSVPPPGELYENIRAVFDSDLTASLYDNDVIHKTGRTKLITFTFCRQTRNESLPQITCTEHLMKFGRVVFDRSERTDIQTDKQTCEHADHNTSNTYRRRSITTSCQRILPKGRIAQRGQICFTGRPWDNV